jgi:hypothetical protein
VVDVYRDAGLFRRNDLAFAADTDVNRSVSREHAHILHDRVSGEYRLFNDRWYHARRRVRNVDRARRHESGSAPQRPRHQARARRRDSLRQAVVRPYKILYTIDVADSKPVEFRGSSLEDLRAFPLTARREAGHQLDQVQNGREPDKRYRELLKELGQ